MYVSDRFIFLQLQKTGCTHIARLFSEHFNGRQVGKHNRACPRLLNSGRTIIGSVRNPWDWYVSLWSFGCGGHGGLYARLTGREVGETEGSASGASAPAWQSCYDNPSSIELFHRWLRMIFDPAHAVEIGEAYSESSLATFAGFYTYRYLRLFCRDLSRLTDGTLQDLPTLLDFATDGTLLEEVIRNERLEEDFLRVLRCLGEPTPSERAAKVKSLARTNASARARDYSAYYDRETAALVEEREHIICQLYNYRNPLDSVRTAADSC